MLYAFILGNHPQLSLAELKTVLNNFKIIKNLNDLLIIKVKKLDPIKLLEQLGGTIKIVEIKYKIKSLDELNLNRLIQKTAPKIKFGFSVYHKNKFPKTLKRMGIKFKQNLKEKNINARLVESRKNILSSVILQKEKCQDIVLIYNAQNIFVGKTLAVQKFQEYSKRDYGRPARDVYSGMLPPKIAQIMINLAGVRKNDLILDPFCGSGTILQEAMLLGYKNLIGSDISKKAINNTKLNLSWLKKNHNINIFQCDAKKISLKLDQKVKAIITEVDLGPVKGKIKLPKTKMELKKLYWKIFKEFKKILKPQAKLVIAFPAWRITNKVISLNLNLEKLGYKINNKYLYGRPEAQVLREIYLLKYG